MKCTVQAALQILTKANPNDTIELNMYTTTMTTKKDILRAKYRHLIGQTISLSEAADKYGIPRATIAAWNYRSNYIDPIDTTSYPALFDEAEIAYLADIYRQRRATGSKAPLLDDNGLPYELKNPGLARYRRNKKN